MAACCCGPVLAALPHLNCTLQDGGETTKAAFRPALQPYADQTVQTRRFRLKVSISGNRGEAALVKIYAYYRRGSAYHLLHLSQYRVPLEAGVPGASPFMGSHSLYSPEMGRELGYECSIEPQHRGLP